MRALPSGRCTLSAHQAWLWADAVGADPAAGVHPGVAYMVAVRGGASIAEVMELLDAEPSACLFGELGFAFASPLAVGRTYAVDAQIVSVERKSGRRFPVFDRVELEYRVSDANTRADVVTVTQVWVVVRSEDPA